MNEYNQIIHGHSTKNWSKTAQERDFILINVIKECVRGKGKAYTCLTWFSPAVTLNKAFIERGRKVEKSV